VAPVSAPAPIDTRRRLHGAGLRATASRVAVFDALRDAGGHHGVDDIVALVARRGEPLSRMTVYNVVGDLREVGLVMCADAGPGRALYEVSDVWHHHFVCRACGEVTDVPCTKGRKPCLVPAGPKGATVDEAQVIFRGVCRSCRSTKS
jgi:Fur family ferric uptake transcriptional regulator